MMAAPPSPSNCRREPRLEKRAAASLGAEWDWKGASPNIWASRGVWAAARVKGGYPPVAKVSAAIPEEGAQSRHRAKLTNATQILPRLPPTPSFPQDTIKRFNITPYPNIVKGFQGILWVKKGARRVPPGFPGRPGKEGGRPVPSPRTRRGPPGRRRGPAGSACLPDR